MSRQTVSVIIPAYNAAETIERCLTSILRQTWGCLEIIVVDDGSQDSTADVVERVAEAEPRVVLLRQANAGVAAARNTAILRASGQYIVLQDADDYSHPKRIERQVRFLVAHPEYVLVGCGARLQDRDGRSLGMQFGSATQTTMPTFVNPSVVFRRSVFEEFLYNENLRYGEDTDLLRRILAGYQGTSLLLPLYFYVQGGAQLTSTDIVGSCVRSILFEELGREVEVAGHPTANVSTLEEAMALGIDIEVLEDRIYSRFEYVLRLHQRSRKRAEFQQCLQTLRLVRDETDSQSFHRRLSTLLAFYDPKRRGRTILNLLVSNRDARSGLVRLAVRHAQYRAHILKTNIKYREWDWRQEA